MTVQSGLWHLPGALVLASGSTTRRLLLEAAQVPVEVRPAAIDERAVEVPLREAGAPPAAIARHLAAAKAVAVSAALPGRLVLGADQTLALAGQMFTKPSTLGDARRQLEALAGQTHSLHAAWALARDGALVAEGLADAHLRMRIPTPAFLDAYLAAEGDHVLASVGAYRLEGLGIHLFERIDGDHTTILGLPLLSLLPALRQNGYLLG